MQRSQKMKILRYVESTNVSFRSPWSDLMLEHMRRGNEQLLLCQPGGNMAAEAQQAGIPTLTWRSLIPAIPAINLCYPLILRRERPSLVHTRLSNAASIAGFWGGITGVPTIAMLDGVYKLKYYRRADHYTACSRWAKDEMIKRGLDGERIDVIYNSIAVEKYDRRAQKNNAGALRSETRARLALAESERLLLAAGTFVPAKGFDLLIKAFAALNDREDLKLVIVGDGPLRENYGSLIKELNLGGRVLLSPSYAADIRPWLWGADYFVMPSLAEPFGIILLEAMASGLPVLATDSGGPSEIVSDGEAGLLCAAGSAEALTEGLCSLLALDHWQLAAMKERAASRLCTFTSEAMADREEQVYEKVLERFRELRKSLAAA